MHFIEQLRIRASRQRAWDIGDKFWMRQWLLDEARRATSTAREFKANYAAQCREMAFEFGGAPEVRVGNPHWETEPRVPAGNPDGGQWTRLAGDVPGIGHNQDPSGDNSEKPSRALGHHFVPKSVIKSIEGLSDEARKVFEGATTGRLFYEGNNQWDAAHRIYRDAVHNALKDFMTEQGIAPESMTGEQAQSFLKQIETSADPRIRNFNRMIKLREIIRNIRQRGLFRGDE